MIRSWWPVVLIGCAEVSDPATYPPIEPANERSFVLLELFTSQSCSSCPGAERNLNAIAARAREEGSRVFTAAWHVTTWNGLGWVDRYSDPRYSDRQLDYVDAIDGQRFTPQVIVQGQAGLNGHDTEGLYQTQERWLTTPGRFDVALQIDPLDADSLQVPAQITPLPEDAQLQVVVLERELVDEIPSGENAGRTLVQDEVVRAWSTADVADPSVVLSLPDDLRPEKASILAFVQERGSRIVVAAQDTDTLDRWLSE